MKKDYKEILKETINNVNKLYRMASFNIVIEDSQYISHLCKIKFELKEIVKKEMSFTLEHIYEMSTDDSFLIHYINLLSTMFEYNDSIGDGIEESSKRHFNKLDEINKELVELIEEAEQYATV